MAVNVHHIPVYLHPLYRDKFNTRPALCLNMEAAYDQIISLAMFLGMTDEDIRKVIVEAKKNVCGWICNQMN